MAVTDVPIAYSHTAGLAYTAGGAVTCGSVWACPVCSAKVRRVRTSEVEHVAKWHAGKGGKLLLLTLTLRHTKDDGLAKLVEGLCESWRVVQRSREWRATRSELLTGMVRALEVTHGFSSHGQRRNGWHPHLHVLLLVAPGVDVDTAAARIRYELLDGWHDSLAVTLGDEYASDAVSGVDLREIDADGAQYVSKIAAEVTRADLKGSARQVWSLIDERRWSKWGEYCGAMRGRRAVQFSRGLRAAAGLAGELSDEEAAERLMLDLDEGVVVLVVERRRWNRLMRDGDALTLLVGLAERCALVRAGP